MPVSGEFGGSRNVQTSPEAILDMHRAPSAREAKSRAIEKLVICSDCTRDVCWSYECPSLATTPSGFPETPKKRCMRCLRASARRFIKAFHHCQPTTNVHHPKSLHQIRLGKQTALRHLEGIPFRCPLLSRGTIYRSGRIEPHMHSKGLETSVASCMYPVITHPQRPAHLRHPNHHYPNSYPHYFYSSDAL